MSATILNLDSLPKADGGGTLRRIVKDKGGSDQIVDFWSDITKFDVVKLEAVLKLATADSNYDLTSFIRGVEYQGFDRIFFVKLCLSKMSVSVFCRFAVLGAVRGSNWKRITETCESMPQDMNTAFTSVGFVKTPAKKIDITILRCTASIPHWCAYYLHKSGVEKKLNMDCPAALQFPSAASLPMSRDVRMQHISFCVAFSSLLPGGNFRMTIYLTAMSNSVPLADIPAEVTTLLKISSESESYKLTEDEVKTYGSQVAIKK